MKTFANVVDGIVHEIIPEENPALPGFSLEQRYTPEFVSKLIEIPSGVPVEPNWTYQSEDGFQPPNEPEEATEP